MLARKRVDPIVGDVFVKALDAVDTCENVAQRAWRGGKQFGKTLALVWRGRLFRIVVDQRCVDRRASVHVAKANHVCEVITVGVGSSHSFWPFVLNVVTLLYIQTDLFCTFQKSFRKNF